MTSVPFTWSRVFQVFRISLDETTAGRELKASGFAKTVGSPWSLRPECVGRCSLVQSLDLVAFGPSQRLEVMGSERGTGR